jgi:hypothetical protein
MLHPNSIRAAIFTGFVDLTALSFDESYDELSRLDEALIRIIGVEPAFMRPPFGKWVSAASTLEDLMYLMSSLFCSYNEIVQKVYAIPWHLADREILTCADFTGCCEKRTENSDLGFRLWRFKEGDGRGEQQRL